MKKVFMIMRGLGECTPYIFTDEKQANTFAEFKNTIGNGYYFVKEQNLYDTMADYKEEGFDDYLRSLQNKVQFLQEKQLYYISLLSEETLQHKNVQISAKQAKKYIELLEDSSRVWTVHEGEEFVVTPAEKNRLHEIMDENKSEVKKAIAEIDKIQDTRAKTTKYREENSTILPF